MKKVKKVKKGDRLLFLPELFIIGLGLAIEKRNFSAFDCQVFPMIRPDSRDRALYFRDRKSSLSPFFTFFKKKQAVPLFFRQGVLK